MGSSKLIERVPWDCAALGTEAFKLNAATAEALALAKASGHYTVRVDPLASKELLHRGGFYYCDTLIEPFCGAEQLRLVSHASAGLDPRPPLAPLLAMGQGAFRHGRFHRDFNVERRKADQRYENWTKSLHEAGKIYGLLWDGELAGFIGCEDGKLVLHAMDERHRGRGIAKYLWSAVCAELRQRGAREITSSISAVNLSAVSLYASLGFHFRDPIDIYHRTIP